MSNLTNSNSDLIQGLVLLLRSEIGDGSNGFSTNSEYNVPNVWGESVPDSARQEYPRGTVDVISGNDFELSVDLGIRLREVTVKFVVFAKANGPVEELIDDIEDTVAGEWEKDNPDTGNPYLGDWSLREVDGFTDLNESKETEGDLRYSRSVDVIFETIKNN